MTATATASPAGPILLVAIAALAFILGVLIGDANGDLKARRRRLPDTAYTDAVQGGLTRGALLIALERNRQITTEGYTPERDTLYVDAELTQAARAYLDTAWWVHRPTIPPLVWPWSNDSFKWHHDPIRNLQKAGALIAAELDRLSTTAQEPRP